VIIFINVPWVSDLESICEAEPKSFEIAGQKPKACEVSLEILGFRRMIQCEAGRPLAYFVGIEGITLAMFLPEVLKAGIHIGIPDFQW
jgi:hypothetical protein